MEKNLLPTRFRASFILAASLLLVPCSHLSATLITDPVGDFLPTYTGPKNGDMDVVSAQVFFDGSDFTFDATMNGLIGTTSGGLYVWGVDRGKGFAAFPTVAPGVTFDSVLVLNDSGAGTLTDLISGASTTISGVTIAGSSISAVVPLAYLPTEGLNPDAYLVNLWPRSGVGGLPVISDFAPNNSDALVTDVAPVPEAASVSMVGGALLAGGVLFHRRRKRSV